MHSNVLVLLYLVMYMVSGCAAFPEASTWCYIVQYFLKLGAYPFEVMAVLNICT